MYNLANTNSPEKKMKEALDAAFYVFRENYRKFQGRRNIRTIAIIERLAKAFTVGDPYGEDLVGISEDLKSLMLIVADRTYEQRRNLNLIATFEEIADQ